MSERGTPVNYNYNANEQRGKGKAIEEMARTDALQKRTQKDQIHSNVLNEIAKFYKEIEKHPRRSKYETMLPSRKDLKAIRNASPQQLAAYSEALSRNKAEYDQEIKRIAPAATPSAPAAQPKAVVPPASAVPTPSNTTTNPRAASAPVAAATIERLGNKAKALSGYAEKSAGAAAALKAARDKLPATSRQKNQTQAAKPTDNTAASALNLLGMPASVGMGAPIGGIATGAAMKMAQQATQQPDTRSDKADALIQKFDNQTTQATKDANKAVQSQVSQAASPLNQLQPFDEVKAMEDQMRRGGYQIQEGGLKKDGAGYHVIDEQGRKLMVAPTAAMRFNVQDQMNGTNKISNTLKAGQTMTDRASAIMGRDPQRPPQAGGVVTTDMRPVNTEQNPRGKVYMDALGNEFKEQTYRELDAKNRGIPLDPRMQTREYAHSMAAAADAQSRQVQPAPLAASAQNPAGTTNRVLTDPKYGGSGVGYGTNEAVGAQQAANKMAATEAAKRSASLPPVADQSAVIAKYPEVGDANSPFNKLFTDTYHASPEPSNVMGVADSLFGEGGTNSKAYNLAIKNRVTPPQPSNGNPAIVGTNSAGVAASPNAAAPTQDTFGGLSADDITRKKDADFNQSQADSVAKTQAALSEQEERAKKAAAMLYEPRDAHKAKISMVPTGV